MEATGGTVAACPACERSKKGRCHTCAARQNLQTHYVRQRTSQGLAADEPLTPGYVRRRWAELKARGLCRNPSCQFDNPPVVKFANCPGCRALKQKWHQDRMKAHRVPCLGKGCRRKAGPRSASGLCAQCSRSQSVTKMLAAKRRREEQAANEMRQRTYTDQGATFSADRNFRYTLWRRWDSPILQREGTVLWVMLNPSTADEWNLDATVRRCEDYTKAWGYGGLVVVNIFGLCSKDPKDLYRALARGVDPTQQGHHNDEAIGREAAKADLVITAWGVHGAMKNRGPEVLDALLENRSVHHLGLNADRSPRHPLYLPADLRPTQWTREDQLAMRRLSGTKRKLKGV